MLLPVGRRTNRHRRVVAAYLAGASGGAVFTACLAWLASGFLQPLPSPLRAASLVVLAVVVWGARSGALGGRLRLPENRRQIPYEVFGRGLVRGAWRFGFEMGTGVRTYVPVAAPYLLLGGLLLARPTLGQALVAAVGFAAGRTLPLMARLSPEQRRAMTSDLLHAVEHRAAQAAASLTVLIGALLLV